MKAFRIFLLSLVAAPSCKAFTSSGGRGSWNQYQGRSSSLNAADDQQQESDVSSSFFSTEDLLEGKANDDTWQPWLAEYGHLLNLSPKLSVRAPLAQERGKGGVLVSGSSVSPLEVLLRMPRQLCVADSDIHGSKAAAAAAQATKFSWATDLTAAALYALHSSGKKAGISNNEIDRAKHAWIDNWIEGGWATDGADLGPPDVRWGGKDVTGTLMATGSDNDHNIYAKFRFPCHPVVFRASKGLALLTGASEEDARKALLCRGRYYRSMRDALLPLVENPSSERKGSIRERRSWDVSDMLSRILARATTLELDDDDDDDGDDDDVNMANSIVVPLYDRLAHSYQENTKLVACGDEVLLVATREIPVGGQLTRDYTLAPQLGEDASEGALRLLLQFGLPPSAWPAPNSD